MKMKTTVKMAVKTKPSGNIKSKVKMAVNTKPKYKKA